MSHSFFLSFKTVYFRILITLNLPVYPILYLSLLFWKCFKSVNSIIQINFAIIHWMNIEPSFDKKFLFIITYFLKWTFYHLIFWRLRINKFLNYLRNFHITFIFIYTHKLIFKHFTKIYEIMCCNMLLNQNIFFCG